jgi:electron transfer flavoprotein beta subunit
MAAAVTAFGIDGDTLRICCTNDGVSAEYEGAVPAVLSVCNGTDMVRSPTVMGMRRSKKAAIERLTLADIGISAENAGLHGSPTRTAAVETMSFRKGKRCVCTDADAGAQALIELIKGGNRDE